jgi:hypothetical protein
MFSSPRICIIDYPPTENSEAIKLFSDFLSLPSIKKITKILLLTKYTPLFILNASNHMKVLTTTLVCRFIIGPGSTATLCPLHDPLLSATHSICHFLVSNIVATHMGSRIDGI